MRANGALKAMVRGMAAVVVSPLAATARVGLLCGSDACYYFLAQTLALFPGAPGSFLRVAYYRMTLPSVSPDFRIGFGSFFSKHTATVGRNVSIGAFSIIGCVDVGDNVRVSSRVSLLSGKYQHGSAVVAVAMPGDVLFERIRIGSGTWIGEGSIVAANVGMNCVIAAGSVVTRAVPDDHLASGNPGRVASRGAWGAQVSGHRTDLCPDRF